MSSKRAGKAKEEGNFTASRLPARHQVKAALRDLLPTSAKRSLRLVVESNYPHAPTPAPDIRSKVHTFLAVKEALVIRQAHRQLNEAANDIYQHSFIMTYDAMAENDGEFDESVMDYLDNQTQMLCNLLDAENLRAVLRNETLEPCFVERFLFDLIEYSKTDNGRAVSILLADERCIVNVFHLEECLKKDFTAMAEVLQQDERVKEDIQMCNVCSKNTGCYNCANWNRWERNLRFCCDCVLKDDRFVRAVKIISAQNVIKKGAFDALQKSTTGSSAGKRLTAKKFSFLNAKFVNGKSANPVSMRMEKFGVSIDYHSVQLACEPECAQVRFQRREARRGKERGRI